MKGIGNLSSRYAGSSLANEEARKKAMLGNGGLVNFSGAADFSHENETGLVFNIQLHNEFSGMKRIALFPGDLVSKDEISLVAGVTVDGIAKDGVVVEETTGSGESEVTTRVTCSAEKLEYLQRFLRRNPTRIVEMQVNAESKPQLANKIAFTQLSPFDQLGTTSFRPNDYRKAADNDTLMAEIPCKDIQLDDQTLMTVELAPNSGISISMYFGAMRNDAKTLFDQAKVALG